MTIRTKVNIVAAFSIIIAVAAAGIGFISIFNAREKVQYIVTDSSPLQIETSKLRQNLEEISANFAMLGMAEDESALDRLRADTAAVLAVNDEMIRKIERLKPGTVDSGMKAIGNAYVELLLISENRLKGRRMISQASQKIDADVGKVDRSIANLRADMERIQKESRELLAATRKESYKVNATVKTLIGLQVKLKDISAVMKDIDSVTNRFMLAPLDDKMRAHLGAIKRIAAKDGDPPVINEIKESARAIDSRFNSILSLRAKYLTGGDEDARGEYESQKKTAENTLAEMDKKITESIDGIELRLLQENAKMDYAVQTSIQVSVLDDSLIEVSMLSKELSLLLKEIITSEVKDDILVRLNKVNSVVGSVNKELDEIRQSLVKIGRTDKASTVEDARAAVKEIQGEITGGEGIGYVALSGIENREKAGRIFSEIKVFIRKQTVSGDAIVRDAEVGQASVLSSLDKASTTGLLLLLAVTAGAVASGVFFRRWISGALSEPIKVIVDSVDAIAKGQFTRKIVLKNTGGGDEMLTIAQGINHMASELQGMYEGLENKVEEATRNLLDKNSELLRTNENMERTYQALTVEKVKLDAVLKHMADGLMVVDIEGRIILTNPSLKRIFGVGEGTSISAQFASSSYEQFRSAINEVLGGKIPVCVLEMKVDERVLKITLSAIKRGDELLGVVSTFSDITNEKEVDRMKTEFISTVSHELRTPLTSVLGFARLIEKKFDDVISPLVHTDDKKSLRAVKQIVDNLGIIVSEGERLTALINDVLDIAKMEAGKVDWKRDFITIEEIIERAATATSSLFDQKGLVMVKDFAADLPMFEGDRDRLIQVLINLISNAVKFTGTGAVTCSAKRQDDYIIVSVTDSGMGIAEEDLPKVFEKFKQVGDTLTDKPTGTGLGLPICKEIIEHHGGRIWAESLIGKGSTFSFTLPAMLSDSESSPPSVKRLLKHFQDSLPAATAADKGGKKCVLVVDDEANIRKFLRLVLEENGYDVTEAKDGMDAIAQVKKKRPDIITLDIMMPGISGFDVAAVLKNNPETMEIPIIILSVIEDEERGYRLGIDKYLTKPIDTAALLKSIESLLSRGTSKKKVMIVDEDESTVKALSELLETRGYSVASACNGTECVNKALTFRPDMIILNRIISDSENMVKTLRFEKGLENIYFVYIEEGNK